MCRASFCIEEDLAGRGGLCDGEDGDGAVQEPVVLDFADADSLHRRKDRGFLDAGKGEERDFGQDRGTAVFTIDYGTYEVSSTAKSDSTH